MYVIKGLRWNIQLVYIDIVLEVMYILLRDGVKEKKLKVKGSKVIVLLFYK